MNEQDAVTTLIGSGVSAMLVGLLLKVIGWYRDAMEARVKEHKDMRDIVISIFLQFDKPTSLPPDLSRKLRDLQRETSEN